MGVPQEDVDQELWICDRCDMAGRVLADEIACRRSEEDNVGGSRRSEFFSDSTTFWDSSAAGLGAMAGGLLARRSICVGGIIRDQS